MTGSTSAPAWVAEVLTEPNLIVVQRRILSNLAGLDLDRCRRVCRQWRYVVEDIAPRRPQFCWQTFGIDELSGPQTEAVWAHLLEFLKEMPIIAGHLLIWTSRALLKMMRYHRQQRIRGRDLTADLQRHLPQNCVITGSVVYDKVVGTTKCMRETRCYDKFDSCVSVLAIREHSDLLALPVALVPLPPQDQYSFQKVDFRDTLNPVHDVPHFPHLTTLCVGKMGPVVCPATAFVSFLNYSHKLDNVDWDEDFVPPVLISPCMYANYNPKVLSTAFSQRPHNPSFVQGLQLHGEKVRYLCLMLEARPDIQTGEFLRLSELAYENIDAAWKPGKSSFALQFVGYTLGGIPSLAIRDRIRYCMKRNSAALRRQFPDTPVLGVATALNSNARKEWFYTFMMSAIDSGIQIYRGWNASERNIRLLYRGGDSWPPPGKSVDELYDDERYGSYQQDGYYNDFLLDEYLENHYTYKESRRGMDGSRPTALHNLPMGVNAQWVQEVEGYRNDAPGSDAGGSDASCCEEGGNDASRRSERGGYAVSREEGENDESVSSVRGGGMCEGDGEHSVVVCEREVEDAFRMSSSFCSHTPTQGVCVRDEVAASGVCKREEKPAKEEYKRDEKGGLGGYDTQEKNTGRTRETAEKNAEGECERSKKDTREVRKRSKKDARYMHDRNKNDPETQRRDPVSPDSQSADGESQTAKERQIGTPTEDGHCQAYGQVGKDSKGHGTVVDVSSDSEEERFLVDGFLLHLTSKADGRGRGKALEALTSFTGPVVCFSQAVKKFFKSQTPQGRPIISLAQEMSQDDFFAYVTDALHAVAERIYDEDDILEFMEELRHERQSAGQDVSQDSGQNVGQCFGQDICQNAGQHFGEIPDQNIGQGHNSAHEASISVDIHHPTSMQTEVEQKPSTDQSFVGDTESQRSNGVVGGEPNGDVAKTSNFAVNRSEFEHENSFNNEFLRKKSNIGDRNCAGPSCLSPNTAKDEQEHGVKNKTGEEEGEMDEQTARHMAARLISYLHIHEKDDEENGTDEDTESPFSKFLKALGYVAEILREGQVDISSPSPTLSHEDTVDMSSPSPVEPSTHSPEDTVDMSPSTEPSSHSHEDAVDMSPSSPTEPSTYSYEDTVDMSPFSSTEPSTPWSGGLCGAAWVNELEENEAIGDQEIGDDQEVREAGQNQRKGTEHESSYKGSRTHYQQRSQTNRHGNSKEEGDFTAHCDTSQCPFCLNGQEPYIQLSLTKLDPDLIEADILALRQGSLSVEPNIQRSLMKLDANLIEADILALGQARLSVDEYDSQADSVTDSNDCSTSTSEMYGSRAPPFSLRPKPKRKWSSSTQHSFTDDDMQTDSSDSLRLPKRQNSLQRETVPRRSSSDEDIQIVDVLRPRAQKEPLKMDWKHKTSSDDSPWESRGVNSVHNILSLQRHSSTDDDFIATGENVSGILKRQKGGLLKDLKRQSSSDESTFENRDHNDVQKKNLPAHSRMQNGGFARNVKRHSSSDDDVNDFLHRCRFRSRPEKGQKRVQKIKATRRSSSDDDVQMKENASRLSRKQNGGQVNGERKVSTDDDVSYHHQQQHLSRQQSDLRRRTLTRKISSNDDGQVPGHSRIQNGGQIIQKRKLSIDDDVSYHSHHCRDDSDQKQSHQKKFDVSRVDDGQRLHRDSKFHVSNNDTHHVHFDVINNSDVQKQRHQSNFDAKHDSVDQKQRHDMNVDASNNGDQDECGHSKIDVSDDINYQKQRHRLDANSDHKHAHQSHSDVKDDDEQKKRHDSNHDVSSDQRQRHHETFDPSVPGPSRPQNGHGGVLEMKLKPSSSSEDDGYRAGNVPIVLHHLASSDDSEYESSGSDGEPLRDGYDDYDEDCTFDQIILFVSVPED